MRPLDSPALAASDVPGQGRRARLAVLVAILAVVAGSPASGRAAQVRGFTAAPAVARVYDAILDADFDAVPRLLPSTCPSAPHEACDTLEALALWWRISIDPKSPQLDAAFGQAVEKAITATEAWTRREPERAEARFYVGAAYGARVQWRVLRGERLSAARDGKRIKEALERALALDPAMHDAQFGLGMYRYYADVAPAVLRWLRWLFLLPGGNRAEGLQQMVAARDRGQLVRGEADFQLHLAYLWYEKRFPEALEIVLGLQRRYPRNPLFWQIEAEIRDDYMHDAKASLAVSTRLLELAESRQVHQPALASVVARLNIARQLDRLGDRTRAEDMLATLVRERPAAPAGATERAQRLLQQIRLR